MASNKPKKNRSARDRRLARQRAQRQTRRGDTYPLHRLQPPFKSYSEWVRVPDEAKNLVEHPAARHPDIDDDAKDLLDALMRLGPRYDGIVPMAAVYLDQQIRRGEIMPAARGQGRTRVGDSRNRRPQRRRHRDAGASRILEHIGLNGASETPATTILTPASWNSPYAQWRRLPRSMAPGRLRPRRPSC